MISGWINAIAAKPVLHRLFFMVLLIVFGIAVSVASFFTAQYNQAGNIQKELAQSATELANFKLEGFRAALENHKNRLIAAKESAAFKALIDQPSADRLKAATELFLSLSATSGEIYQFRFLDQNGQEVIRIDRNRPGNTPFVVEREALQNKADRYYFKQSAALPRGSVWFSKVDLNMERGRIEQPIVPTLRIASPVYRLDGFKGIVIVNLYLSSLLETLTYSPSFYISLLDYEGHFLIGQDGGQSWSRYLAPDGSALNTPKTGENAAGLDYAQKALLSREISNVLPTADRALLVLNPKAQTVSDMEHSQNLFMLTTLGVVLVLSLPLALLLSSLPVKLSEHLVEAKEALKKQWALVDRFVLLTQTDTRGVITYATRAYRELTGFSSQEIIGQTHKLVRHPDTPEALYRQMWQQLAQGETWRGELKNRKKDGSEYWLKMTIKPTYDKSDSLIGYACYMQNITYQKRVEELSVTDEMTGLYNRRYFNEKAPELLERARREGRGFAFLILDVDHFKKYNDTYGHEAGDRVLKSVAAALQATRKKSEDVVFRMGGEEFALLFAYDDADQAQAYAQSLCEAIEALKIEHKANTASAYVSASFGLALKADDLDGYYKTADEALYQAKESGRNRVCTAL